MHAYWTSMFWSIDSCQNRVPAAQYHLTVFRAQVSTHRSQVFLKLSADKVLVFKWSQAQVYFVKFIWNMLCSYAAQIKFWFQTDFGRENSASCYRQGRELLLTFLAIFLTPVTRWSRSTCNFYALIGQNFTGEFKRKLVYFDTWNWQSFVSTCDVFNYLFPLDVQNEIQLLSGVFCYSWLVCLLGFWLRNTSLVKVGNPISDGIVFVFTLLDA